MRLDALENKLIKFGGLNPILSDNPQISAIDQSSARLLLFLGRKWVSFHQETLYLTSLVPSSYREVVTATVAEWAAHLAHARTEDPVYGPIESIADLLEFTREIRTLLRDPDHMNNLWTQSGDNQ
jgi:hypothetical protein